MDDWFTMIAREGTDDNFVLPENWSNLSDVEINQRNQDRNWVVCPTIGPMLTQQQEYDEEEDDDSALNGVLP
eukprot:6581734-Ditylum_brightwellii.AAC.1